jgi:hypothetical protein
MRTRCKFKCDSVTDHGEAKSVVLTPVTSGSDENKTFWKYTPGGRFEMTWVNPNVGFKPGKEYFIEIEEAGVSESKPNA